ncbi:MAG: nitronate monooxygenase, partial [Stenotrophomonas maltophilia]
LTISNTLPAMTIDVTSRTPVLGAITGGLSGPGLHPVSLALVYRAVQVVDLPIIGVGGIFSAEDALQYLMAGATAVQIGSANLADLWAPVNILRQLEGFLREEGVGNLKEIIGAAQVKAPV